MSEVNRQFAQVQDAFYFQNIVDQYSIRVTLDLEAESEIIRWSHSAQIKTCLILVSQQNSYSISHLLGTVTTQ